MTALCNWQHLVANREFVAVAVRRKLLTCFDNTCMTGPRMAGYLGRVGALAHDSPARF